MHTCLPQLCVFTSTIVTPSTEPIPVLSGTEPTSVLIGTEPAFVLSGVGSCLRVSPCSHETKFVGLLSTGPVATGGTVCSQVVQLPQAVPVVGSLVAGVVAAARA